MSGIYSVLLGDQFDRLPHILRNAFSGECVATGEFEFFPGETLYQKILTKIYRLPSYSGKITTVLKVSGDEKNEKWERVFSGKSYVTYQSIEGRLLRERLGVACIDFHITTENDRILFSAVRAFVAGIKLPKILMLEISASVTDSNQGWYSEVSFSHVWAGCLLKYCGKLEIK